MSIDWQPWSSTAFDRARDQRRPVLLSIVTSWCGHCAEMDRTAYALPEAIDLVENSYVAIRVDADRRPDISTRYMLGGWPTTAFLTPDGELLGGGTYVAAERLPQILDQVAVTFAEHGGKLAGVRAEHPGVERAVPGDADVAERTLVEHLLASFDRETGTFGVAFPEPAPIQVAMDLFRRDGSLEARDVAVEALDAMGWGGLHDDRDGGFFRCARGPRWDEPRREKLLDTNAALLALYLEAFETFGLTRYRDRAVDVIRFVQRELADHASAGWGASAWEGAIDRTLYTSANGAMVCSMLQASRVLDDEELRDFTIRSLEHVVLQSYRPGNGVAPYVDGAPQVRGLLEDHVAMIRANLDAYEITGNIVYEMMAEELAHYILRVLWDGNGFRDRIHDDGDVGLLRQIVRPFVANCDAARALKRVAALSGEPAFIDAAHDAVQAVVPQAPAQGLHSAHYVLALREVGRR
jgi:uncharacterized protein